jgi:4-amino-4-deoxy-L-arabinose transferase-like glycosyltransferase
VSVALVVLAGAALRVGLVSAGVVPFNSDEAIVGLMARHILGGQLPIFFYGQAYMGSLDAMLVALGFQLFGQQVIVIRAIQILLVSGTIITTMLLAQRVRPGTVAPVIAGLLLALAPVNVTLYTTVSLGGYGEALLLGNLILLLALDAGNLPSPWWRFLLWGVVAGLGFWAFGLTLVYSLPAAALLTVVALGWPRRYALVRAGWALLGIILGALPWLAYAAEHGLATLMEELTGSAIAGASGLSWLASLPAHFLNLILFGVTVIVGIRPPWGLVWLGGPLAPLALAFWGGVIVWIVRRREGSRDADRALWLLKGVVVATLVGFVATPFGADPSGRYFLPLAAPMAVMAAAMLAELRPRIRSIAWAALAVLPLAFQLWGNIQVARRMPPGLTTQFDSSTQIDHSHDGELIEFLLAHGDTRGYTNYWVAYPLAFLSSEQLIFVPRLPYHNDLRYTSRDDRYPSYDDLVAGSPRVAFITTRLPALDERMRAGLTARAIAWQEVRIGDYQVFYGLSSPVAPGDLLGGA